MTIARAGEGAQRVPQNLALFFLGREPLPCLLQNLPELLSGNVIHFMWTCLDVFCCVCRLLQLMAQLHLGSELLLHLCQIIFQAGLLCRPFFLLLLDPELLKLGIQGVVQLFGGGAVLGALLAQS